MDDDGNMQNDQERLTTDRQPLLFMCKKPKKWHNNSEKDKKIVNKLTRSAIHSNIKLYEGGDILVKDTIQAIKDTEQRAEEMTENARKEAAEIRENAKNEAAEIEKDMIEKARKRAQEALQEARKDADQKLEAAKQAAGEEASLLRDKAGELEKAAVEGVIQKLL